MYDLIICTYDIKSQCQRESVAGYRPMRIEIAATIYNYLKGSQRFAQFAKFYIVLVAAWSSALARALFLLSWIVLAFLFST